VKRETKTINKENRMPIKKKNTTRNTIIILAILAVFIALLFIYFEPNQHLTEVVLFP